MNKQYKIGITFSGGAARGIAHTGVLQGLVDNGIEPDIISGCSAGALVGALYAEGFSPNDIFHFVENKSLYKVVKLGMPARGFMEIAYFRKLLTRHIPHNSFEGLKKPLYVAVTNLNKGGCEFIHEGELIDFVIASCSVPILFKPVRINGHLYVDGGVINNLPVEPVRRQCQFMIGVNVNTINYTEKFSGMFAIGQRILDLSLWVTMEMRFNQCDVLIEPDTSALGHLALISTTLL
jgi:NTE family protein